MPFSHKHYFLFIITLSLIIITKSNSFPQSNPNELPIDGLLKTIEDSQEQNVENLLD